MLPHIQPNLIRPLRRFASWSQSALAERADVAVTTVQRWEGRDGLWRADRAWGAERCLDALKAAGFTADALLDPRTTLPAATADQGRARCGARRPDGTSCPVPAVEGKRRCAGHGGLSTGARTVEGLARIAAAQRVRWRLYRDRKAENRAGSP